MFREAFQRRRCLMPDPVYSVAKNAWYYFRNITYLGEYSVACHLFHCAMEITRSAGVCLL
jgi:hypothetical protein